MSLTKLAAVFAALVALAGPAAAQISVVVSAGSKHQPSQREIVEMFVGLKTNWADGSRVQLVDQPDTPEGKRFYETFLKQTPNSVRKELTRLVFAGEAMPPLRVDNATAVKKAVAEGSLRIGYIATSALDATVREVYRIP